MSRREWRRQENSARKQQHKQQRRTEARNSVRGREDRRNGSNKDNQRVKKKCFGEIFQVSCVKCLAWWSSHWGRYQVRSHSAAAGQGSCSHRMSRVWADSALPKLAPLSPGTDGTLAKPPRHSCPRVFGVCDSFPKAQQFNRGCLRDRPKILLTSELYTLNGLYQLRHTDTSAYGCICTQEKQYFIYIYIYTHI